MDCKLLTTICAVPSCDSKRSDGKRHMFPKDSVLGQEWVEAVNHSILSTLSYDEIRRKAYWICHKHFSPESCYFGGRKSLKSGAVPSLLLPPRDETVVQILMDVPLDAAPTSSPKARLESSMLRDVFSLHYNKSPSTTAIRRSSLHTPENSPRNLDAQNTSPRNSKPPLARKRLLSDAVDDEAVLSSTKIVKTAITHRAKTSFVDRENIEGTVHAGASCIKFLRSQIYLLYLIIFTSVMKEIGEAVDKVANVLQMRNNVSFQRENFKY